MVHSIEGQYHHIEASKDEDDQIDGNNIPNLDLDDVRVHPCLPFDEDIARAILAWMAMRG